MGGVFEVIPGRIRNSVLEFLDFPGPGGVTLCPQSIAPLWMAGKEVEKVLLSTP
jgi:hypothetical protein